ncbi:hypothetical protein FN846DRAFT_787976 [Sphaerosporella brunnea]|uniref:Uncharacterized protein n=1 Tax=Sphaerosporella brunnea TaxID=1250544 RepID=A0A5J5ECY5_9PEZI|nr:hypothetical protein FN846DRAFT_787976 [Sphaerosporella brunnea]
MALNFSSSDSAGYYRYRCRNFYTHNCGNWVWMNNSACAECVVRSPPPPPIAKPGVLPFLYTKFKG